MVKQLKSKKLSGIPEIDKYLTLGLGLEDAIQAPIGIPTHRTYYNNERLISYINRYLSNHETGKSFKELILSLFTQEEIENTHTIQAHSILFKHGFVFPTMRKTISTQLIKKGYYHEEFLEMGFYDSELAKHTENLEILEKLKDHPNRKIRGIIAGRGFFLDHYFNDTSVEVRKKLVYHDYKVDQLAKRKDPEVAKILAIKGINLDKLVHHKDPNVRKAVIDRRFKLHKFENDPDTKVRQKLTSVKHQLEFTKQNEDVRYITNPRRIHEKCILLHQVNPHDFFETKSAKYLKHEHPRIYEIYEKVKQDYDLENKLHPIYVNEIITIASSYTYNHKTDLEALKENFLKADEYAKKHNIHFYTLKNMRDEMSEGEWDDLKTFALENTDVIFLNFDLNNPVKYH